MRLPAPWAMVLALVQATVALSGCTGKEYEPPASSDLSAPPPLPNFLGNWSLVEGDFTLYRIQTRLQRFNLTSGEPNPFPSSCVVPFTYDLDTANRTLRVSTHRALHPTDPGLLRIVYLNEVILGDRCVYRGPFGINENATSPPGCVLYRPENERRALSPWWCDIPFSLDDDPPLQLWVNVSFTLDGSAPGGFTVGLNGRTFAGNASANVTDELRHPTEPIRYEARASLQPLGAWPFGSVRR